MAAGIGSMNFYYERYSVTAGISTDQPLSFEDDTDPGNGWSNYRYKNFNRDYIRHDVDNNQVGVISAYQRHDVDNNPVGVISSYQRYDDQVPPQAVPNPVPPIVPNS